MIKQQPAQGIALMHDFGDALMYHIECDCSAPEHAVKMWIGVTSDKEIKEVEVTFYVHTQTPIWKKGFSRIQAAWDILFKGYHEHEHCLILNEQSALNLASAIDNRVKELNNNK